MSTKPKKRPAKLERFEKPRKYIARKTLYVEGKRIRKGRVFWSDLKNPGVDWIPFSDAKEVKARAEEAAEAEQIAEQKADEQAAADLLEERQSTDNLTDLESESEEELADGKG